MSQDTIKTIRVDEDRLWQRLMEMAKIGASQKGGCNRQALTSVDQQGRALFIQWCEAAGCTVRWDTIGNIFARRPGHNNDLPAVITGSHLDTQPTGGKFDGVYGVLAGLEVIETLNDHQVETEHPLDVVVWTNEEGARFSPAMMGSGVFSNTFDLDETLKITDKAGISVGEALQLTGFSGCDSNRPTAIKASFEAHIEQGPILEAEQKQIGVVSGIQGMRWYDLSIHGQPVHAGPTPMETRRDPFMGLTAICDQLYQLAETHAPWARVNFGDIKALPGVRNTVPETLVLAVDLRHPDQAILDKMDSEFRAIAKQQAARFELTTEIRDEWNLPAVSFSKDCVTTVEAAVDELGYEYMPMFSGAGHDSGYIAKVAPTSMIFVPCEKGISHNEAENAKQEDLAAGCNVLLHSMLKMAKC